MRRLLKIAALGALAMLALVAFRGEATAGEGPTCAPSTGLVPRFCVNVPVGTSVRRETTVPLSTVLAARAEVRVEPGVPAPEVVRLSGAVDSAIARVERSFDRPFATKPRILVFATRASFARATQELFGYTNETAANVAASYGGVFDPATLTIAVSWQSAKGAGLADLIRHELTHLATREILGDAVVPAWLEEGLAARIEQDGDASDGRLVARSLLANAPRTLASVVTLADWHRAHARLGVSLYAISAEMVTAIDSALGRGAVFALLGDVAAGATFENAFRSRAGEDVDDFIARVGDKLASGPRLAVATDDDAAGNVRWTLSGFAPDTDVRIAVSGAGYDLEYGVRTDGIGMYRGTFGSTAAPGTYAITAHSETTTATAIIDTSR